MPVLESFWTGRQRDPTKIRLALLVQYHPKWPMQLGSELPTTIKTFHALSRLGLYHTSNPFCRITLGDQCK